MLVDRKSKCAQVRESIEQREEQLGLQIILAACRQPWPEIGDVVREMIINDSELLVVPQVILKPNDDVGELLEDQAFGHCVT
jgi:hypothetical protein